MQQESKQYVKEFYTLEQLSKEIDISVQSLRGLIRDNRLVASRVCNRYIVTRAAVSELIESTKTTAA